MGVAGSQRVFGLNSVWPTSFFPFFLLPLSSQQSQNVSTCPCSSFFLSLSVDAVRFRGDGDPPSSIPSPLRLPVRTRKRRTRQLISSLFFFTPVLSGGRETKKKFFLPSRSGEERVPLSVSFPLPFLLRFWRRRRQSRGQDCRAFLVVPPSPLSFLLRWQGEGKGSKFTKPRQRRPSPFFLFLRLSIELKIDCRRFPFSFFLPSLPDGEIRKEMATRFDIPLLPFFLFSLFPCTPNGNEENKEE